MHRHHSPPVRKRKGTRAHRRQRQLTDTPASTLSMVTKKHQHIRKMLVIVLATSAPKLPLISKSKPCMASLPTAAPPPLLPNSTFFLQKNMFLTENICFCQDPPLLGALLMPVASRYTKLWSPTSTNMLQAIGPSSAQPVLRYLAAIRLAQRKQAVPAWLENTQTLTQSISTKSREQS